MACALLGNLSTSGGGMICNSSSRKRAQSKILWKPLATTLDAQWFCRVDSEKKMSKSLGNFTIQENSCQVRHLETIRFFFHHPRALQSVELQRSAAPTSTTRAAFEQACTALHQRAISQQTIGLLLLFAGNRFKAAGRKTERQKRSRVLFDLAGEVETGSSARSQPFEIIGLFLR
jgi:cysteinyl-tRNA synthetase